MSRPFVVASFYVDRRADYPEAPDYIPLLLALDGSCRRFGLDHVVLTDNATAPEINDAGLHWNAANELPWNLMRALTEAQACWLETPHDVDTMFVGADCLIRANPLGFIPRADLAVIFRPGHRLHRINNGFMHVPAESRARVAPLFRRIADSCGEAMCDDMVAVEQALAPMPMDYGLHERAGLSVAFLPMETWNAGPRTAHDPARDAFVLHFRGRARKTVMLEWAERWL